MHSPVVIIGAGPAGLSCALWLSNMGVHPTLLEQAAHAGGMLRFNHHVNDWLLGFPDSTGHAIRDRFMGHLEHRNLSLVTSALPTAIIRNDKSFFIEYSCSGQPRKIEADFLVIASGTKPRAPEELVGLAASFPERIMIGAGELHVDEVSPGAQVAILGGGDNAFENACQLAANGISVEIFCRGEARARQEWVERCRKMPGITVHSHTSTGSYELDGGKVSFLASGRPVRADALVVMYGYEPNTGTLREIAPWLKPAIDEGGYIKVDDRQQTSIPHLYAIGDVTDHPLPNLPSAIGQGSVAAKAIMLDAEGGLP